MKTALIDKSGVGKLWPVNHIQSATCFCIVHELKMVFIFLSGRKTLKGQCIVTHENYVRFNFQCPQSFMTQLNSCNRVCMVHKVYLLFNSLQRKFANPWKRWLFFSPCKITKLIKVNRYKVNVGKLISLLCPSSKQVANEIWNKNTI